MNGPETQPIWKYLKEHSETPVQDIDWVSNLSLGIWYPADMMIVSDVEVVELFKILDQGWKG